MHRPFYDFFQIYDGDTFAYPLQTICNQSSSVRIIDTSFPSARILSTFARLPTGTQLSAGDTIYVGTVKGEDWAISRTRPSIRPLFQPHAVARTRFRTQSRYSSNRTTWAPNASTTRLIRTVSGT
jgi:hypothetical protein